MPGRYDARADGRSGTGISRDPRVRQVIERTFVTQGSARTVAAFDLDGTLCRRDTLLPFLRGLCGNLAVLRAVVAVGGPLATALVRNVDAQRGEIKDQLLNQLLDGRSAADVTLAGQRFAHQVAASPGLRPDIYARWQHHRDAGHDLVIVSASLELYVNPLAQLLGGNAGLGTRLEVRADGTLTGHIEGANCRGEEKVRRLDAWLAATAADGADPEDVDVFAYGDSSGDDALLRRADHPTKVRRR
jgi:phosphatidylglycerophosphatase C